MNSYIFIVGKTDPHFETIAAIRALGYKVGLFQDIATEVRDPSQFDVIVPINPALSPVTFTLPPAVEVAGLQCTYENYVVAKAQIGAQLGLPELSEASALMCTDKLLMRQAFARAAPEFTPKFNLASSIDEILAFAETAGYPLFMKPTNLVKSLLVMRCDSQQELIDNFAYAQEHIAELYEKYGVKNRKPQLIVEQFMSGKSCSIAAFVDGNGTPHFCDGIVGLTTAREHGANDNYLYARTLPLQLDEPLRAKLFAAASAGIRALGMQSSAAHVELIYTDDFVGIIEIGARIGGYRPRMYAMSYGLDLHKQELNIAIGKQPDLTGEASSYCAVYELFPDTVGQFTRLSAPINSDDFAYVRVAPAGKPVGPAKEGHKAAAIVIVNEREQAVFRSKRDFIEQLTVEVQS